MTTKFLNDKIGTFKFLLSWRFPRKQAILDDFLSAPKAPPPQKRRVYCYYDHYYDYSYYCRLAVSESHYGGSKTLRSAAGSLKHLVFLGKIHRKSPRIVN